MFDYNKITEYQLSITNYCNAACPQCVRNVNGGAVNPYMPLKHLPRDVIDRAFQPDLVKRLRQIFFCGGFGDPTMHPDFLDILADFRRKCPQVWIYIHSNGGTHDADWWQALADLIGDYGKVDFGIDGLADTNHVYRRNVDWDRLMGNVKAYISRGAKAQWNFLVFRHNQHQIAAAEDLSRSMGFESFLPRRTGRFFNANDASVFDRWPVLDRDGNLEYYLEPADAPDWQNQSVQRIEFIKQQPGGWRAYHDTTKIRCDALLGNKAVITADGLVLPCNFFEHHLYDARYHDVRFMPGSNDLCRDSKGQNQIRELLSRIGHDNISIHHNSLADIFTNQFWNIVVDSWNLSLAEGRIYECANTCGEKFTKVWDQGGTVRS
jgi:MoaA/NifB/PqqE/SkfB family radical SAM enzyme